MQIDIDAILKAEEAAIDQVLPWDFSVKVGGRDHKARPITVGELVALSDPARSGNARITAIMESIFSPPLPKDLSPEQKGAVLTAVMAAATAKKNERIGRAVLRAAIGRTLDG